MKFQEQYSNYIEHYGTRGMRWGVRKEQYKLLNRKQRKSLKAYGNYRRIASKILQKKAKGKNTFSDIEFLKSIHQDVTQDQIIKAKLEKALNVKIDDVSAEVSSKRSVKTLAYLLGVSRDKEYKRLASKLMK